MLPQRLLHRASPLLARMRTVSNGPGSLVGSLTVDPAEPVFAGHFPGFPIFPGVCLVECAHQAALLALTATDDEPPRLTALDRVRFLAPVFPGDIVTVQLTYAPAAGGGWGCAAKVLGERPALGMRFEAALIKLRYGGAASLTGAAADVYPQPIDIGGIKALLPHRYPMLLIDQVNGVDKQGALLATKTVTANEPCYAGLDSASDHSYPAALLAESWCQAAGVLAVQEHPNPDVLTGRVTLFGAITGMRLGAAVQPGAVLRHQVRAQKILSDAAVLEGETLVAGAPVMTVDQIVIALRPMTEVGGAP